MKSLSKGLHSYAMAGANTVLFVSFSLLKHQGVVNFNWYANRTGKKSMHVTESWWELN